MNISIEIKNDKDFIESLSQIRSTILDNLKGVIRVLKHLMIYDSY